MPPSPHESETEEYEEVEVEVEEEEVEEVEVEEEEEEAQPQQKPSTNATASSSSLAKPPAVVSSPAATAPASVPAKQPAASSAPPPTTAPTTASKAPIAAPPVAAATTTSAKTTAAAAPTTSTATSQPKAAAATTARPLQSVYDDDDDDEDEEVEYYYEEIEEIEEEEEDEAAAAAAAADSVFDVPPADASVPEELPLLRFETIGWHPEGSKVEITSVRLTTRYMFIGLSQGTVMVLDVEGKGEISRVQVGDFAVSDMAADDRSDFISACDSEGNIIVQNLNDSKDCFKQNFRKPIKCIAIHPNYSTLDERPILLGADSGLQVSTKGRFLGTRSIKAIIETGKVTSLSWAGQFNVIVAAVDGVVNLIDYTTKSIFYTISRASAAPRDLSSGVTPPFPLSQYRCCISWIEPHTIFIAWGDWVTSLAIKRKSVEELFQAGIRSPLSAVMESGFILKDEPKVGGSGGNKSDASNVRKTRVCGIAPFSEDRILMLIGVLDSCEGMIRSVEVHVAQKHTGHPEFCGRQNLIKHHAMRYHLNFQPAGDMSQREYFIASPDAVIRAVPCDEEDHVNHYVSQEKYVEAFEYAKTANTSNVYLIADLLLNHLLAKGRWAVAAHKVPDMCGAIPARWEAVVKRFEASDKAYMLAPYLPVLPLTEKEKAAKRASSGNNNADSTDTSIFFSSSSANSKKSSNSNKETAAGINSSTSTAAAITLPAMRLEPILYEYVLNSCAHNDLNAFEIAINRFEDHFRPATIISVLERRFFEISTEKASGRNVSDSTLRQVAVLYVRLLGLEQRYKEAFEVLIKVKEKEGTFAFIRRHGLFEKAAEMLPQLFKIDHVGVLTLLEEHIHPSSKQSEFLTPEAVLKQLTNHPEMLYAYLCLFQKQGSAYHNLCKNNAQRIAQLYIDVDRKALLGFLKDFAPCLTDSKAVLDMCKHARLVEEQAYLMTRMGRLDDGLKILVQDMKNVRKAVDVIKDFPQDSDQEFLFEKIVTLIKQIQNQTASSDLLVDKDDRRRRYVVHTVEPNDSWEAIASRYDHPIVEIMAENKDIAVASKIQHVSSLLIPFTGPSSARVREFAHHVKEGDTWGSITTFYHNVLMVDLLEMNQDLLPSKDSLICQQQGDASNNNSNNRSRMSNCINVWVGGKHNNGGPSASPMPNASQTEIRIDIQHLNREVDTWASVSSRNSAIPVLALMKANPNLIGNCPIPLRNSKGEPTIVKVPMAIVGGGGGLDVGGSANNGNDSNSVGFSSILNGSGSNTNNNTANPSEGGGAYGGADIGRHTLHTVIPNQTWLSVAEAYFPTEDKKRATAAAFELMKLNPSAAANSKITTSAKLTITINLFADLFKAVSDPSVCEDTAINPVFLLREIPEGHPLPAVGRHLSRIATSRQRQVDMRSMLLGTLQGDIKGMHARMRLARTRPMRIDPRTVDSSGRRLGGGNNNTMLNNDDDSSPASSANFFSQLSNRLGGVGGGAAASSSSRVNNGGNKMVGGSGGVGGAMAAPRSGGGGGKCPASSSYQFQLSTTTLYCSHCNEHISANGVPMVVFNCQHAYHDKCMLDYLIASDTFRTEQLGNFGGSNSTPAAGAAADAAATNTNKIEDLERFFRDPKSYFKPKQVPSRPIPHCKQCFTSSQHNSEE